MAKEKTIIGWNEWLSLPQIGIPLIKAKVDTGARTSALHAFSVDPFTKGGAPWVSFSLHPLVHAKSPLITCEAPVIDRRLVTDSGGRGERRLVIETLTVINGLSRAIEITLTNREKMAYRMLLGRQGVRKLGYLVNPSQSTLLGKYTPLEALSHYKDNT